MSSKVEIEKVYDLSPMQEGMLYHSLLEENTEAYFVQISFSIKGLLDIKVFEKAIKQLVQRHEILRTTFFYKNVKKPKQVVLNNKKAQINFRDLSDLTEEESSNFIKSYFLDDRKHKFDLERDTLIRFTIFKLSDVDFKVVWSFPHILLDGWSLGIVLKELFINYESIKNGTPLELEIAKPFKNFIDWLGEQDYDQALAYWKSFLDGYETRAILPTKNIHMESNRKQKNFEFNLGERLIRNLILLSKKLNVTLNTMIQAIWSILLQRYTNRDDVIFGAVHSGRTADIEGIDNMVGLFINTIPVRVGPGNTFREFVTNIQEQATASATYGFYPLYKIQEQSVHKRNLFDHIIVFENYPLSSELGNARDLQISDLTSLEQTNYPLSIAVYPGKSLKFKISYDEYLYDENFIFSFENHIKQVASIVLDNLNIDIKQIDMLTEQEKHQLLVEFNDTEMPYPKEKTIHSLFEEQVEKDPHQVAVVFQEKQLTYKELNERANRLARVLRQRGVTPEDRVGLLMERSLDMIVGMLAVLKAGGAYLPIDPAYPAERIDYMLEDSDSKIVLSKTEDIEQLRKEKQWEGDCLDVRKIDFEGIDESNLTPVNQSRNLAYVIYTSGTTGKPKGVMVEHEGVANLVYHFKEYLEIKEKDRMGQFASIAFDASIEEITKCLLNGATLYIIPEEVIYNYHSFENYINQNQITILTLPPTYLRHLNGKSLESIRFLVSAGSASSKELVELWGEKYVNAYGPTEATIGATMWKPTKHDQYNTVPIGKPVGNKSVYILNKHLQLQPVGVFGELFIGGEGVARGYLNRPELTKEKFLPNPFSTGEKMYRTGDLARYLPDGNIEFLGRIDHQVKIRGYRIELGEIESTLLEHPNVKDATVMDWKDSENETYLCAYVVFRNSDASIELRDYLSQKLAAYMVPSFIEELDTIPLTSNGKIDRRALSKPTGADQFKEYVAPTTELEKKLVEIWQEVLGIEQIGVNDNFFNLGGHSLKAIQLMSNIHKELQIEIPVRVIFEYPTVQQLARSLQNQGRVESQSIEPIPERSYYPVSSAQKRMYVLQQMDLSATHYNMPGAFFLEGSLEYQRLERAIQKLIERHEPLRTSFDVVHGEPVQIVHEEVNFTLNVNQALEEDIQEKMQEFIQPFNLEKDPLFRAELIQLGNEKHLLLIDMHHIISDGVSMGVLFNDLSSIYQGKMPQKLKIHYKDFVMWEEQWMKSEGFKQQENHWLNVFSDPVPVLELPTDYPRPDMQNFEGSHLGFVLNEEITRSLKQLAAETGTTLYMLLLSAYNILLHKYTNQSDILIGTPVAGRPHPDVQSMTGMFVNTLVMRNYPEGQKQITEFIQEVKSGAITAYDHADYPFEMLVEKLTLDRDPGRNPLFQAMFTMQNFDEGLLDLEGLQVRPYEIDYRISKFDLTLSARETQKYIECEIEYSTALFFEETIQRMSEHFIQIVKAMVAYPEEKISKMDILTEQEKHQLLVEFNDTEMPYPKEKTIHSLFEEQVEKNPHQVAVVFQEKQLTYKELNERVNRLARVLRQRGVTSEDRVGLLMERSLDMIVGMLAILKAGGAYLPIDPAYPAERIDYMLEDSGCKIVLSQTEVIEQLWEEKQWEGNCLDVRKIDFEGIDESNLTPVNQSRNLAYVMYTSGTTGRPKGVEVIHQNVVRLVKDTNYATLNEKQVLLQLAPIAFDASTFEIWGSLLNRAKLVMIGSNRPTLEEIAFTLEHEKITTMFLTTALFNTMVDHQLMALKGVQQLLMGGETVSVPHVKKALSLNSLQLVHVYGPTENTTFSSYYVVPETWEEESTIPIGKPINNTKIFILDERAQVVPLGVVGEIYTAREGVARGYLNRPELTKEKFVPNPFSPGEKMYRTGDLARYLPDGNIEFLGRIDHQVKIRGYRIELGEIESTLLEHPNVKDATVMDWKEGESETFLCAYVVLKEPVPSAELRDYLSQKLPAYMVPSFFEELDTIPLTSNDKIDRKALPKPDISNQSKEYVAPTTELEKKLVEIWEEVLGIEQIGVNDNFFNLGGHSLKAIQLMSNIHKELQIEIPVRVIFEYPTVQQLARSLQNQGRVESQSIEPIPERSYYPVSSAQKRMYVLQQMDLSATHYNMPGAFFLEGSLEYQRLERAIQKLIERHEPLRTSFDVVHGEPVQIVHEEVNFTLNVNQALEEDIQEKMQEFIQPFNLEKDPLFRAELIQLGNEKHLLLIDMHHIISDGVSMGVLFNDLSSIYQGKMPQKLKIHYKDFVMWEEQWMKSEGFKQQENHWLNVFSDPIPVLELPTDYPRPDMQNFEGSHLGFVLNEEITRSLKQLAAETGTTLYMLLLSAYNILLHKYTNQSDILIGTPVAGRPHPDVQSMTGMFVNTLVMRNYPEGQKQITEFIQEVKSGAITAYDHADYPFEMLVEKLTLDRDPGRNPLFQAMFTMQNFDEGLLDLEGLQVRPYEIDYRISKFDLTLSARETQKYIECEIEYSTALFFEETIQRMSEHFIQIVKAMVAYPEEKISKMDILTEQEKHQLLVEFNDTEMPYPKEKTIHSLFEEQVEKNPHQVAVVFQEKQLTYKELNERANRLARVLRQRGVTSEDRVGLLMERSLDMIVGMLAILKAGGAYLPIDPAYPAERIDYMLEDSGSKIVLSQTEVIEQLWEEKQWEGDCLDVRKIDFKGIDESNLMPVNHSRNLAYVIYTSGTTGKPKGVMIEHIGIPNLVNSFKTAFKLKNGDRITQFANYTFDTSVGEIWTALLTSSTLILVPEDVIYNYGAFERLVLQQRVNALILPPTYLKHLDKNSFNFVRNIIVGGSASTPSLAKEWKNIYINAYGPTETTVTSTLWTEVEANQNEHISSVPIGKPVYNTQIYILNDDLQLQPIGITGEMYISGDSVARGYLNRSELTKEKFVPNPFSPGEKMYRTGDLARYLPDGNIEFLGRIDHQVKIRGYRIELGEIESTLLEHPNVKDATVMDWKEGESETFLCAYVVLKEPVPSAELRDYLSQKLPAYMVPSFFEELDTIPLTSNDKIDRKALPKPDISNQSKEYVAPTTELEKKLVEIWEEVLGIEQIGVNDNFFNLGGHSLKAIQLMSNIHKELQIEIPVRVIFEYPTVQQLARSLQNQGRVESQSIEPIPERSYYPVSSAQKRMYVLQQMDLSATHYNMPGAFFLEGSLEYQRLERAIQKLIERHEPLRTSFDVVHGEPVQIVHEEVNFTLNVNQALEEDIQEKMQEFIQPFNLEKDPLFRAELIQLGNEKHLLLIDMHHIISDGVSMGVLFNDLSSIYQGKMPQKLKIHYKDFVMWEEQWMKSEGFKQQENHWLNVFSDPIPVLELPTDYPRPDMQNFEGSHLGFVLNEEITRSLKQLAAETGTTLYMLLLSAYNILLHKYTNQSDILIGTPVAGRPHPDVQSMTGMFVNTLVMRNYPEGQKQITEFIQEVKSGAITAYDHADYPFEMLVEKLTLDRDPGRNPLFQAMFTMQNFDEGLLDLEGLQVRPYEIDYRISKFDLTLSARETQKYIECEIEYSTALFFEETIQRMSEHFIQIVKAMVAYPEEKISKMDILTEQEKHQLLVEFNDTEMPYPKEKTIHSLFEEQVEKNPHQVAVVFQEKQLTYKELNERANRLARVLRQRGVTSEDRVGLLMERSLDMIVGMLAILKAGGAYLPIDPAYPAERIDYMLEDSGSKIVLSQTEVIEQLWEEKQWEGDCLDVRKIDFEGIDESNLTPVNQSRNLAYVMYTSGTTGKPKGVMVEHEGVANLVYHFKEYLEIKEKDRMGQFASIAFDASIEEITKCLLNGATLYIIPKEVIYNYHSFENYINQNRITILTLPPTYLRHLNGKSLESIRFLVSAGSASSKELVELWGKKYANAYGPTEATIGATMWKPTKNDQYNTVPIGKPVGNKSVYILNKHLQLQPIGVFGELCIGGEGLARGYLNQPRLTEEKFIPNPFSPGEKIYRTGDLARYLPDGNIEFLGRIDHQVKIRGYRIELGEIENALLEHPNVKDITVIDWKDSENETFLCAYVVFKNPDASIELRDYLSQKLPAYMVPSFIEELDTIPLTSNGKVDRRALPKPTGADQFKEDVAPTTELEKKLVEIWEEVLGVEQIGVTDNFFNLGGHSLKAILISSKLNKALDIEIGVPAIFKYQTVRELNKYLLSTDVQHGISQITTLLTKKSYPTNNNVFCLPPVSGYSTIFFELAQLIDGYTLYGLDYVHKEDRLQQYINQIVNIQNEGPYILMGYSAGCPLVFELAKEMETQGYEVSDLIMLDGKPRENVQYISENDVKKVAEESVDVFLRFNKAYFSQIGRQELVKTVKNYHLYLNKLINNGQVKANIHMVRSEENSNEKVNWFKLTTNEFCEYQGFGNHMEMLFSSHVKRNAKLIGDIIKRKVFNI